MLKKVVLKFVIIIILLFVFIKPYFLKIENINNNNVQTNEKVDISGIESKEITSLPYIRNENKSRISFPIFKANLENVN